MSVPDHAVVPGVLPAVVVTGAPASGKSTLARELVRELGGALLDQDMATGPLVAVVGARRSPRPRHPALAGLTREARYETIVGSPSTTCGPGHRSSSSRRSRPSAGTPWPGRR